MSIKKVIIALAALGVCSCTSPEEERKQSFYAALKNATPCTRFNTLTEKAQCIGRNILEEDGRRNLDTKYDVEKIQILINLSSLADKGFITPDQMWTKYGYESARIEAQAKYDDGPSTRQKIGAALSAFSVAGQSFQNGYNQAGNYYRPPSAVTCSTVPSPAGMASVRCY